MFSQQRRKTEKQETTHQLLVSIVTPSYNQGKFIQQTIESVLNQDYKHIEYWVIDGGSTDDTISILQKFENDPRFHWVSEKDNGQADAINKGWERCHGDILAWLNSDDTYLPGTISSVVEAFVKNPDAVGVYGECIYTDTEGKPWRQSVQGPITKSQVLALSCYIDQPTVFVNSKDIYRVGLTDPTFHHQLDYELWLRLGFPNHFVYLNQFLATWRAHPDTKSISNTKRAGDELRRLLQYASASKYDLSLSEQHILRTGVQHRALIYHLADRVDLQLINEALSFTWQNPSICADVWLQVVKTVIKSIITSSGISNNQLRNFINNFRRQINK
jgi:glycosyltransferase involved in cell wall biosynthesis